jgi:hypothetical protein
VRSRTPYARCEEASQSLAGAGMPTSDSQVTIWSFNLSSVPFNPTTSPWPFNWSSVGDICAACQRRRLRRRSPGWAGLAAPGMGTGGTHDHRRPDRTLLRPKYSRGAGGAASGLRLTGAATPPACWNPCTRPGGAPPTAVQTIASILGRSNGAWV